MPQLDIAIILNNLGKIGQVLQVAGPILAVLIAALAYKRQGNDSRRAQASKVVMTITSQLAEHTGTDASPKVVIENHSDLPIFKVETICWSRRFSTHALPFVSRLGPKKDHVVFLAEELSDHLSGAVTFSDASGHRWKRWTDGRLKRA